MERFRRAYLASRLANRLAAIAAKTWYYPAYGVARLFGRTSQSLLALQIHRCSEVISVERGVRFLCSNVNYYLRTKYTYPKEVLTLRWIDSFPPNSVLWDIGANVGCFTLYAAMRGVKVWAFEPQPANYAALSANIVANSLTKTATALNVALYCDAKIARLSGVALEAGAVMNVFDRSVEATHPGLRTTVQFSALSLRADELVERFGLAVPDFVKLDVDGNELDILRGAPALLSNPKLKGLLIEMTPGHADYEPTLELLTGHGLRAAERDTHGAVQNVIFVRS